MSYEEYFLNYAKQSGVNVVKDERELGFYLEHNGNKMYVTIACFFQLPHDAYDEEQELFDDELPDGTVISHKEIVHVPELTDEDIRGQLRAMIDYLIHR